MSYCPKNAPAFNSRPVSEDHAAAWCRRAYRAGYEQCAGCELRKRWGVGDPAPQVKSVPVGPVQRSLF